MLTFESSLLIGIGVWFVIRCLISGFYVVDQNQRVILTTFGRAPRLGNATTANDPVSATLRPEEKGRYDYPRVAITPPGLHFKFPWQRAHKVTIATQTASIAFDPETPSANQRGTVLEAVTKDQLNTGLRGQIRYAVHESNIYAFVFGVKNPIAHVMGYFVSILRERIANFEAPHRAEGDLGPVSSHVAGISINDIRKNLSSLNQHMETECKSSVARYGMVLDAALITEIDPPTEVESALAAINTAHNQVSSEISLAEAAADQKIVQSRRAVEIETLKAQAEVQLLRQMYDQLNRLKSSGADAMRLYLRNVKLKLFNQAKRVVLEDKP